LTRRQIAFFQVFKYSIYALLILNIWLFFAEEWVASAYRFADGLEFRDISEGFAATIDTAAWVVLLLAFELETWVLHDRHLTPRVTWTLKGLRSLCYTIIVYALYGYVSKLLFLLGATPLPGLADLCTLLNRGWVYAVDLDEYEVLTAANCATLSNAASFLQFPKLSAVVDPAGYTEILRLAWVDVINASVWVGVVLLLEVDVYLQARDRLHGVAERLSRWAKYLMYSTLLLAAVYWGIKGDFVDFWDAFLWLVAFAFIEMNFFEWQQEMRDARLSGPR
jgi:hypothetical protein